MLFHLLANRIYLGEIVHQGVGHPGEHQPIIDQDLWDAVRQRIDANAIERGSGRNLRDASLLAGTIRDGHGRRMSPSHAVKKGRRYRYYITGLHHFEFGYWYLRRLKADRSDGSSLNHSPFARRSAKRRCQYASIPGGSSVWMA
jgi:hypothetical protein